MASRAILYIDIGTTRPRTDRPLLSTHAVSASGYGSPSQRIIFSISLFRCMYPYTNNVRFVCRGRFGLFLNDTKRPDWYVNMVHLVRFKISRTKLSRQSYCAIFSTLPKKLKIGIVAWRSPRHKIPAISPHNIKNIKVVIADPYLG